jgi:transcriptional regulator GlxA family with amidase domain
MLCRRINSRLASALVALAMVMSFLAPTQARADDSAKPAASADAQKKEPVRTLGVILYPKFELLDVYGPVEMFGNLGSRLKVVMVAQQAGPVPSAQSAKVVADYGFDDCPQLDLILVPGGNGTLTEMRNQTMLNWLRERADKAEITMSVCSGSALLAKAGLLDGRRATSNKQYFSIATGAGPKVDWVRKARWVDDGNRVTSSGVSAGIDMSLHVIERLFGIKTAEALATATEYQWHRDADNDPFARDLK